MSSGCLRWRFSLEETKTGLNFSHFTEVSFVISDNLWERPAEMTCRRDDVCGIRVREEERREDIRDYFRKYHDRWEHCLPGGQHRKVTSVKEAFRIPGLVRDHHCTGRRESVLYSERSGNQTRVLSEQRYKASGTGRLERRGGRDRVKSCAGGV